MVKLQLRFSEKIFLFRLGHAPTTSTILEKRARALWSDINGAPCNKLAGGGHHHNVSLPSRGMLQNTREFSYSDTQYIHHFSSQRLWKVSYPRRLTYSLSGIKPTTILVRRVEPQNFNANQSAIYACKCTSFETAKEKCSLRDFLKVRSFI